MLDAYARLYADLLSRREKAQSLPWHENPARHRSVDPASGGPVAGTHRSYACFGEAWTYHEFRDGRRSFRSFLNNKIGPTHALGPATSRYAYSPRPIDPCCAKIFIIYDAVLVHGLWQYLGRTVKIISASQRTRRISCCPTEC